MKTIGGFIVFELTTRRIIKIHNHRKTATNQWRKLGMEGFAIKAVADRFYYEVQGYVR